MKLLNTNNNNMNTVKTRQLRFGSSLPSSVLQKRTEKFMNNMLMYNLLNNIVYSMMMTVDVCLFIISYYILLFSYLIKL